MFDFEDLEERIDARDSGELGPNEDIKVAKFNAELETQVKKMDNMWLDSQQIQNETETLNSSLVELTEAQNSASKERIQSIGLGHSKNEAQPEPEAETESVCREADVVTALVAEDEGGLSTSATKKASGKELNEELGRRRAAVDEEGETFESIPEAPTADFREGVSAEAAGAVGSSTAIVGDVDQETLEATLVSGNSCRASAADSEEVPSVFRLYYKNHILPGVAHEVADRLFQTSELGSEADDMPPLKLMEDQRVNFDEFAKTSENETFLEGDDDDEMPPLTRQTQPKMSSRRRIHLVSRPWQGHYGEDEEEEEDLPPLEAHQSAATHEDEQEQGNEDYDILPVSQTGLPRRLDLEARTHAKDRSRPKAKAKLPWAPRPDPASASRVHTWHVFRPRRDGDEASTTSQGAPSSVTDHRQPQRQHVGKGQKTWTSQQHVPDAKTGRSKGKGKRNDSASGHKGGKYNEDRAGSHPGSQVSSLKGKPPTWRSDRSHGKPPSESDYGADSRIDSDTSWVPSLFANRRPAAAQKRAIIHRRLPQEFARGVKARMPADALSHNSRGSGTPEDPLEPSSSLSPEAPRVWRSRNSVLQDGMDYSRSPEPVPHDEIDSATGRLYRLLQKNKRSPVTHIEDISDSDSFSEPLTPSNGKGAIGPGVAPRSRHGTLGKQHGTQHLRRGASPQPKQRSIARGMASRYVK